MAVCITMYNEHVSELKETLNGLIHNYNSFRNDKTKYPKFSKDDFLIFIVCDGFDNIPNCIKKYAKKKGFYDEEELFRRGFADREKSKNGKIKMKDIKDLMDNDVKKEDYPSNLLHIF